MQDGRLLSGRSQAIALPAGEGLTATHLPADWCGGRGASRAPSGLRRNRRRAFSVTPDGGLRERGEAKFVCQASPLAFCLGRTTAFGMGSGRSSGRDGIGRTMSRWGSPLAR